MDHFDWLGRAEQIPGPAEATTVRTPREFSARLLRRSASRAPWLRMVAWILPCLLFLTRASALDDRKQISQYVQTSLTDKTGLPQNSVDAIAQTSDGYLWFGTQEGLARFDGLNVTVFDVQRNRELHDNFIKVLEAGHDGSLWVGTRETVLHLRNGVFQNVLSAQSPVNVMHETRDGRLWVGTAQGLFVVQNNKAQFVPPPRGTPPLSIHCMVETPDGVLWLGTGQGLVSLGVQDPSRPFRLYGSAEGIPAAAVRSLASAPDGSLWIGSAEGLLHWKKTPLASWAADQLPVRSLMNSLLVDHGGHLWIGFDHDGIATLRQGSIVRYTARQGLANDDIAKLFEDRDGHLWIGLGEGGVLELRDGLFSSFGKAEGLAEDMVWSVLGARDGSVWVGTDSKGLDRIDKSGSVRHFTVEDGLAGGTIATIAEDRNGIIWTGSERGVLNRIENGQISSFRDIVNKEKRLQVAVPDPSGDLWLGFHTMNGLVRFHPATGEFTHFAVPGLINTAALAPDGSLWIGTDHGGVSHFVKDHVERTFTAADGLLGNFSTAIYVDKDGVVWSGSAPGGLSRIKNGHITTYSVEQGLGNLSVGSVVEDNLGNLWMTCNKGIFRVSKAELNAYADGLIPAVHSVVYGTTDGMRSAECNFGTNPAVWKTSDGHIWFITTAGLLLIDPVHSQAQNTQHMPRVEYVLYNRRPVPFENGVSVGPGAGDLEIGFTAPDFTAPERLRFRYRLENFDGDWVEAGTRREAFYTKVPPGSYRLEIQSADRDGDWSAQPFVMAFKIKPHFWQTLWFRALCFLIILLSGNVFYRIRVRMLVASNHELEAKVGARTRELQEALQIAAKARDDLHEQATRDSLTRLWNRRSILEILDNELARARRRGQGICVLMADVDHFKRVNDTLGHVIGDRVLEQVAGRVLSLIRPYDSAGRYGGEEFLIVLPGCSQLDGQRRAEEFRRYIASSAVGEGDFLLSVTCSFGLGWGNASDPGISAAGLIGDADRALYAAKQGGRDRVCLASNVAPAIKAAAGTTLADTTLAAR